MFQVEIYGRVRRAVRVQGLHTYKLKRSVYICKLFMTQ